MSSEVKPIRIYTKKDLKPIPSHIIEFLREVRNAEPRLHDWYYDRSVKEFKRLLESAEQIVTVFVCSGSLKPELRLDKRYSYVTLSRTASIIEIEARRYWWDRHDEFRKIVDKECEGLKGRAFDECVSGIMKRIYPKVKKIAIVELRFHLPLSYKDKLDLLYKARWRYESRRLYNLPQPFSRWDERTSWEQFYFAKLRERWVFAFGDPASSGARALHSMWSSRIITLGIPMRGIILWYDNVNHLWFVDEFDRPVICPIDAFGHIKLAGEDFRRFVKEAMKKGFYTVYFDSDILGREPKIRLYWGHPWWYDWLREN